MPLAERLGSTEPRLKNAAIECVVVLLCSGRRAMARASSPASTSGVSGILQPRPRHGQATTIRVRAGAATPVASIRSRCLRLADHPPRSFLGILPLTDRRLFVDTDWF